jgi:hypothetical protein
MALDLFTFTDVYRHQSFCRESSSKKKTDVIESIEEGGKLQVPVAYQVRRYQGADPITQVSSINDHNLEFDDDEKDDNFPTADLECDDDDDDTPQPRAESQLFSHCMPFVPAIVSAAAR